LTDTWFSSTSTVQGEGGVGAGNGSRCDISAGGGYTGDGGGNGGTGGKGYGCGGGGAGGYSGNGGKGANRTYNTGDSPCGVSSTADNENGSGGGGGGGHSIGGGGGVGIYGQGANGAKGATRCDGGGGGSGGLDGQDALNQSNVGGEYSYGNDALCFGGAGASSGSGVTAAGGNGVIRIVWSTDGTTRSFPSTNVSSLNDPALKFNSSSKQTDVDYMGKTSTSVILSAGHSDINVNGARYIYYAHA